MSSERNSRISSQIILGVVASSLGLAFLLGNLDVIDGRLVGQVWPLVFVVMGILKVRHARAGQGYLVAGILILLGTVMTLHRVGWVHFSWRTWWPVVLILVGGFLVLRKSVRQVGVPYAAAEEEGLLDATAVFSTCRRRVRSQDFRGGEVSAIMGGCEIDLRDATLKCDAVLNVMAVMGGIELKVPADWTVILQGVGILGGFDEKTVPPPDASKRIFIRGYSVMGGLDVKN